MPLTSGSGSSSSSRRKPTRSRSRLTRNSERAKLIKRIQEALRAITTSIANNDSNRKLLVRISKFDIV
jgi:hypothetical protein